MFTLGKRNCEKHSPVRMQCGVWEVGGRGTLGNAPLHLPVSFTALNSEILYNSIVDP